MKKKILLTGALLFSMIINAQINNLNDLINYFSMDTSSFSQSLNKNPNWEYRGIGYKNVYGRNDLVKEYYNFNCLTCNESQILNRVFLYNKVARRVSAETLEFISSNQNLLKTIKAT